MGGCRPGFERVDHPRCRCCRPCHRRRFPCHCYDFPRASGAHPILTTPPSAPSCVLGLHKASTLSEIIARPPSAPSCVLGLYKASTLSEIIARPPALHPASWDCTRRRHFLKFHLPLLLTTYRCHLPLTAATTARPSVDCQISYLTPTSTSILPGPFHYGSLHHLAPHRGGRSQLSRPVFASALSAQGCRVENGFSLSLRSPPLLPPNS